MLVFSPNTANARRQVRSHVRVPTHVQTPQHEQKLARANITVNRAIAHAK